MKSLVPKIYYLYYSHRFNEVLNLLDEFEKTTPLTPKLLIIKGDCIQLAIPGDKYDLPDVELAYRKAIAIDNQYVEAWKELGWFYLCVEDDSKRAIVAFQKSIKICYKKSVQKNKSLRCSRQEMTEAVIGKAMCLLEIFSASDALTYLECNKLKNLLDKEQIEKEKIEMKNKFDVLYDEISILD